MSSSAPPEQPARPSLAAFRYSRRALGLVWSTSPALTLVLAALTLVAGVLPAVAAWVGQHIVDSVVAAIEMRQGGDVPELDAVLRWVGLEGLVVAGIAGAQRGLALAEALLRARLGHRVHRLILEKALRLALPQFENAELYDKLTRARREASSRPLSLVKRSFGLVQNLISLASYAVLLLQFSGWTVVILALAGLPAFIAEAKFSGDAFQLFRWRSPESRMQMYLETALAREDHAKEVKLFGLGPLFLGRYERIFKRLYAEDRRLSIRRESWGFVLGLVGTLAFYGAYAWIALATVAGRITLGQMTMYLLVFRQGQAAVTAALSAVSGMYEDNLYLSNLYEYLEQEESPSGGKASRGPAPGAGLAFDAVGFRYPGSNAPALEDISFQLRPGQSLALVGENGAGKTTLIKLLTRLYTPDAGRITLDGLDIREWEAGALHRRIGVIFQDFNRYQLPAGQNVGVGDVEGIEDEERCRAAAERGEAAAFLESLPEGYATQLGGWFRGGRELSGGQWQKVALSRAFMREHADILVLDEPTAAMDAGAEARVFEHFRKLARDKMVILISHRFSTVRQADQILVVDGGRIVEQGDHSELMALGGRYARLFSLQAAGYR